VIKDQWQISDRQREGDFLALLQSATPVGLPTYIWHNDGRVNDSAVSTMGQLRAGLSWPEGEEFLTFHISNVSGTSKLLARDSIPLLGRVHTRLVIEPVGRPLLEFITYTELLCAIREAIKGCWKPISVPFPGSNVGRSRLHVHAHSILHRDISYGNTLLLPPHKYGMLIDFDHAIFTHRQRSSSARHHTGTFDFLAIEILEEKSSTYHCTTWRVSLMCCSGLLFTLSARAPKWNAETRAPRIHDFQAKAGLRQSRGQVVFFCKTKAGDH